MNPSQRAGDPKNVSRVPGKKTTRKEDIMRVVAFMCLHTLLYERKHGVDRLQSVILGDFPLKVLISALIRPYSFDSFAHPLSISIFVLPPLERRRKVSWKEESLSEDFSSSFSCPLPTFLGGKKPERRGDEGGLLPIHGCQLAGKVFISVPRAALEGFLFPLLTFFLTRHKLYTTSMSHVCIEQ